MLIVAIIAWVAVILWLGERLDHHFRDKFASALLTVGVAVITFPLILWIGGPA